MAELVDAHDSKSCGVIHGSSILPPGTRNMQKIIVILGPTASGKSDLAVKVAEWVQHEKIGGYSGAEVISADSRQVYKGLDIGTGKITAEEMRGVPHHCLDIANPHDRFSVSDWKKCAETAIDEIVSRGKVPIVCGGTGFYINALVDNLEFQDIDIDPEAQKKLEQKTVEELFAELKKIDPTRAQALNNGSDNKNKRRLIRSIMIAEQLGSVPPLVSKSSNPKYDALLIGISIPDEELAGRIEARLAKRIDTGMILEAQKLHAGTARSRAGEHIDALSLNRMDELGLEYRYLAQFLVGKIDAKQLVDSLSTKIWQYAKRQMTWFKKDKRIKWFELGGTEKDTAEQVILRAQGEISIFLK